MISAFLITAISADGFIAHNENESSMAWTSGADKTFFKERTKQAGVVIMGSKTFATIGKALPGRLTVVYSRKKQQYPEGVEVTDKEPRELLADLEKRGYAEVAICGGASIYTLFAKSGAINKLYLTIEPQVFGSGVRLFNDEINLSLSLASTKQLSSDVLLLEYLVKS